MEKLKNSVENQLILMDKFGLTAEEYLIIELLFLCIEGKTNEPILSYYNLPGNHTNLGEVLSSLQNKSVILKSCKFQKGAPFDRDLIQFNEMFLRNYRKSSGELGQELFRAYPNEAVIQGQSVPLKNWAKKFKSEDELNFYYGKAIGWNPTKHSHVLELIQWSKNNDLFGLNMNFGDWVISKMWESIEAHKDGKGAITFDTLTSI